MTIYTPGIYDISNDEYHSSEGISRSGLLKFKKAPIHYWYHYLNPLKPEKEESKDFLIGNALHTLLLEPDQFEKRYFIISKIDKRTKEGKLNWSIVESQKGNRQILSGDEYNLVNSMAASIKTNLDASKIISGAEYEKSLYWIDNDTDILCKARPDIMHPNIIVDIKSAEDASHSSFQRSVYAYGYHIQAAMIREAMHSILNKIITDFVFVVVEKSPPYAVGIYILSEESLEKGKEEFKKLLAKYKECKEKNEWPSYEISQINLPYYV